MFTNGLRPGVLNTKIANELTAAKAMITHLNATSERISVIPRAITMMPPTIRVVQPQVETVLLNPKRLV